jgi:hypothetical protein
MADQIEINIHLKEDEETQGGAESNATGKGGNVAGMSQASSTQSGGTKSKTIDTKKLAKYVSSQTIDVFLNNTKSIISQNIGMVTGKSELQQRVNFGMEFVQKGVNTYKNAQAGALLFGTGGAVIGIALSVIGGVIDYGFRTSQLNLERSLEDRQISQTRSRAGAGFNRSREGT